MEVISLSVVIGLDGRGGTMPQFDSDFKPLFVVGRRVRISVFYGEMLWRL